MMVQPANLVRGFLRQMTLAMEDTLQQALVVCLILAYLQINSFSLGAVSPSEKAGH